MSDKIQIYSNTVSYFDDMDVSKFTKHINKTKKDLSKKYRNIKVNFEDEWDYDYCYTKIVFYGQLKKKT